MKSESLLSDRELLIIAEAARVVSESPPKLNFNEKLLTSGITLIASFFIGLIISVLCWGIAWIWNHIL